MAHVAVFCMWVWHCPYCDTHLKAQGERTVLQSAEFHIHRAHQPTVALPDSSWDQSLEREHWAFHVRPKTEPTMTLVGGVA